MEKKFLDDQSRHDDYSIFIGLLIIGILRLSQRA